MLLRIADFKDVEFGLSTTPNPHTPLPLKAAAAVLH
jgi:hypothetical protein